MSSHTVEVKISNKDAQLLRAEHHNADLSGAVKAAIREAVENARLRAEYPQPHTPNASTVRALRAKPGKGDKSFETPVEAIAYLRKRFK